MKCKYYLQKPEISAEQCSGIHAAGPKGKSQGGRQHWEKNWVRTWVNHKDISSKMPKLLLT